MMVQPTPTLADALRLLVIQPTALCNLNCRYCYVPERSDPSRLKLSTFDKLLTVLSNSNLLSQQQTIDLLWHAGEPLTVGIDFYLQANEILKARLCGRWVVNQSIQTNATLVTSEWCRFFVEEGISVGVSLDGPQVIHDSNRPTRSGAGSFDKVMHAIDLFRRFQIPINALCVLTPATLYHPGLIFDFFRSEGIVDLAFNVEEKEGIHLASALQSGQSLGRTTTALYSSFMRELLRLNRDAGYPLRIREFVALAQKIREWQFSSGFIRRDAEQVAGAILTMTRDGVITSWSPELASAAPHELQKFSLGNIRDIDSIDELLRTDRVQSIQSEIDAGIDRCQRECSYFVVCGGGSPANKVFENGSFATTETMKCSLHTRALVDVFLESLSLRSGLQPCSR
jgi:uncharacterized protein